jgi:uncharacterized DUF497 family protein
MSDVRFVWDKEKAYANLMKHKVSFNEAKSIFYDDNAKLIYDAAHSEAEERFALLGFSSGLRLLIVIHCYRDDDRTIRIISARTATAAEARFYR